MQNQNNQNSNSNETTASKDALSTNQSVNESHKTDKSLTKRIIKLCFFNTLKYTLIAVLFVWLIYHFSAHILNNTIPLILKSYGIENSEIQISRITSNKISIDYFFAEKILDNTGSTEISIQDIRVDYDLNELYRARKINTIYIDGIRNKVQLKSSDEIDLKDKEKGNLLINDLNDIFKAFMKTDITFVDSIIVNKIEQDLQVTPPLNNPQESLHIVSSASLSADFKEHDNLHIKINEINHYAYENLFIEIDKKNNNIDLAIISGFNNDNIFKASMASKQDKDIYAIDTELDLKTLYLLNDQGPKIAIVANLLNQMYFDSAKLTGTITFIDNIMNLDIEMAIKALILNQQSSAKKLLVNADLSFSNDMGNTHLLAINESWNIHQYTGINIQVLEIRDKLANKIAINNLTLSSKPLISKNIVTDNSFIPWEFSINVEGLRFNEKTDDNINNALLINDLAIQMKVLSNKVFKNKNENNDLENLVIQNIDSISLNVSANALKNNDFNLDTMKFNTHLSLYLNEADKAYKKQLDTKNNSYSTLNIRLNTTYLIMTDFTSTEFDVAKLNINFETSDLTLNLLESESKFQLNAIQTDKLTVNFKGIVNKQNSIDSASIDFESVTLSHQGNHDLSLQIANPNSAPLIEFKDLNVTNTIVDHIKFSLQSPIMADYNLQSKIAYWNNIKLQLNNIALANEFVKETLSFNQPVNSLRIDKLALDTSASNIQISSGTYNPDVDDNKISFDLQSKFLNTYTDVSQIELSDKNNQTETSSADSFNISQGFENIELTLAIFGKHLDKASAKLVTKWSQSAKNIDINVNHDFSNDSGDFYFSTNIDYSDAINSNPIGLFESLHLNFIHPALQSNDFTQFDGDFSIRSRWQNLMNPSKQKLSASINWDIQDSNAYLGSYYLNGINSDGDIQILPNLRSFKNFNLKVDSINTGIELYHLTSELDLTPTNEADSLPILTLKNPQFELFNGQIFSDLIKIDLNNLNTEFNIKLANIDLAEIIEQSNIEGLQASGKLSGNLPIVFSKQSINIQKGEVFTNEKGFIKYTPKDETSIKNSVIGIDSVLLALKNYEYYLLKSDIAYLNDGLLTLGIEAKGSSPLLSTKREVHLNLNIEQNIKKLLYSLRLINDVNNPFSEQVEKYYQR